MRNPKAISQNKIALMVKPDSRTKSRTAET